MLIISDFRDYYDSVMSQGVDRTCVYSRKRSTVVLHDAFGRKGQKYPKVPLLRGYGEIRSDNTETTLQSVLVGFCGRICSCVVAHRKQYMCSGKPVRPEKRAFLYSNAALLSWLDAHDMREHYLNEHSWDARKKHIDAFFDQGLNPFLVSLFSTHKVPLFVASFQEGYMSNQLDVSLNARLKDYGFMQVKDTFSAFQEIHQFLSGVLGFANPVIPEVSDADLAAGKGSVTDDGFVYLTG